MTKKSKKTEVKRSLSSRAIRTFRGKEKPIEKKEKKKEEKPEVLSL